MDVQAKIDVLGSCNIALLRRIAVRASMAVLTLAVALLALPSRTAADNIVISVQENGVDGGAVTAVGSGIGSASFAGSYGDFTFNSVTAVGSPYLAEPGLQSSSIDVSGSNAATLNVFVTEQGLSSPSGVASFLSSFTSQTFSGAVTSVTEQTFIGDPGSGTLLASDTFTGIGTSSSTNLTPYLGSTYDETIEYTITTTGAGNVNDSVQMSDPVSTPEPSTLSLVGLGLGGLFLASKKRRLILG